VAWALFFIAMGAVNLYVAFNFSEAAWVNFKLFGMMGMTFLFIILQAFYLARYISETEQKTTPEES
jgi:intracellular septation protein